MFRPGERCKIFIERPDGTMFEMTSVVKEFNISMPTIDVTSLGDGFRSLLPRDIEVTMTLVRNGIITRDEARAEPVYDPLWTTGEQIHAKAASQSEWKCDYCGRPNPRGKETCSSCGSVRSFIYR